MNDRVNKVIVKLGTPIKECLRIMNEAAMQVVIVVNNEDKLAGVVTDGDVRRGIIRNISFEEPIENIMNKNPISLRFPVEKADALELMRKYSIRHIPIVNYRNEVVDLILWNDFLESTKMVYSHKDTPVVIMAGGKGTRLDPFTKILPKPLIPLGERPIIEIIMESFSHYGFNRFIISLNYKGEMIKMYFSENPNNYCIEYIEEKDFLGTVGALALMEDKLQDTFIVSNCDVITDTNFDGLLRFHKENKSDATILGVIRHIKIPYGVLSMQNGNLAEILEKPEYSFIINSGIYVLEPDIVKLIEKGKPMDMTDLLVSAREKGLKVQVYTVTSSWFDVGEWEEYNKAVEFLKKYGEYKRGDDF